METKETAVHLEITTLRLPAFKKNNFQSLNHAPPLSFKIYAGRKDFHLKQVILVLAKCFQGYWKFSSVCNKLMNSCSN